MNSSIESAKPIVSQSGMQLLYSPYSPFVRKVLIVAHEAGVLDCIQLVPTHAHVIQRNYGILHQNPLGQIPTLICRDGKSLADSSVICAYLDQLGGGRMFPEVPEQRWQALLDESMADGLAEAALALRYETALRPAQYRWQDWIDAHVDKIRTVLDAFDQAAGKFDTRFDIGLAALVAALSYIDIRFPNMGWRAPRPVLADWYSRVQDRESVRAMPKP